MNILYISTDPKINPQGFDGKARHIQGTLSELKKQGHKVVFISRPEQLREVFLKHQKENFDFVYERYYVNNFAGLALAKILQIPFFLEFNYSYIYGLEKEKLIDRQLGFKKEKFLLKSASKVFPVSLALKEYLLKIGVLPKHIIINPIGVDPDFFNPQKVKKDFRKKLKLDNKTVVGFVGSFQKYHGVDVILGAMSYLKKKKQMANLHFLLVGREKRKITYREIPAMIKTFDIALMTSPKYQDKFFKEFHGFPAKLLEYMAMEKAVIAPRTKSLANFLIKQRKNGILVNPGDSRDLAKKILELTGNQNLRKKLGKEARKTVIKNFTWSKKVDKIISAYAQQREQ